MQHVPPAAAWTCIDCAAPVTGRRHRCDENWAAHRRDQFKRGSADYRNRKKALDNPVDVDELKDLLSAARGAIEEAGDERRDIYVALVEVDEFLVQMYRILYADD
ncbi:hypothetical protein BN10_20018 [Phycicoccus elongatus Lp2]|uniref:Uncharacterized protein n=1 Tax=Phycicoccus elongatus Lp2 TaxID=1193181 RepID=N0E3U2_9MICO|nr:hypothetical protein [Phycicoccus elongatus]CCH69554.1 hypothetical protein BN10_20018 [Phycicoccus elongatus Lp2]